jgi:hypothetical protein
MALATRTIEGNHSGAFDSRPKVVIMHSTRSTRVDFTDAQELTATLSWFQNPNGASSHWVISELERVRVVPDDLIAWHAAQLNPKSWGIEFTQPTPDRPFTEGHYANAEMVGRYYVSLGVVPVWLSYWNGDDRSGFVDHADTIQGRNSGKSDAGNLFDRARFIASLEDEMSKADVAKYFKDIEQKFRAGTALDPDERELWGWLNSLIERTGRDQDWGGAHNHDISLHDHEIDATMTGKVTGATKKA